MNRKERRAAAKRVRQRKAGLSPDAALQLAKKLHRDGQLDPAEGIYRQILSTVPEHADALHYLGVLKHDKGKSGEAIELIRRALTVSPDYPDAHNNLGNVLIAKGQVEAAAAAYRACLAISPGHANALSNLGSALRESGRFEEALESCRRAIAVDPRHADAHHNSGNILRKLGRTEEAITAFLESIAIRPHDSRNYVSLGALLYKEGRGTEAANVFEQWLRFDPGNPIASHMLAACSGQEVPERASDGYLESTFDRFADSFERVLERLEYRAPELAAAAIAAVFGEPRARLRILDAGCGTGLCGPLLRPWARRLEGVDLSRGMVEKAKHRNLYDELVVGEMTRFLRARSRAYDLIVSADTFIYFGGLEAAFGAAGSALRPRGRLVFTFEKIVDEKPGETYRLNPSGRYSHTRKYVRDALEQSGLSVSSIDTGIIRKESGKPVQGLIATAKME